MTVTRDLIKRTELRLWRSARFLDYSVKPELVEAEEPGVKLNIELTEYELAPSLSKDFSPVETALLKLRDWLSEAPSREEDIVISVRERATGVEVVVILSHRGTLALTKDETVSGKRKLRYAAVLSPEMIALFSPTLQRKLVDTGPQWQLWVDLSVLPLQEPGENRFGFSFGAGFSTSHIDPDLVRYSLVLAPVAFVAQAHHGDEFATIDDGVLTVGGEDFHGRSYAASGELIEILASDSEQGVDVALRVERGAFDRTIQEIQEVTAEHRNFMDAESPAELVGGVSCGGFVAKSVACLVPV